MGFTIPFMVNAPPAKTVLFKRLENRSAATHAESQEDNHIPSRYLSVANLEISGSSERIVHSHPVPAEDQRWGSRIFTLTGGSQRLLSLLHSQMNTSCRSSTRLVGCSTTSYAEKATAVLVWWNVGRSLSSLSPRLFLRPLEVVHRAVLIDTSRNVPLGKARPPPARQALQLRGSHSGNSPV